MVMNRKNACIFDFGGNGKIELCEIWGIGLARFVSGVLYIIPDAPRRQLPIDRLGGPILIRTYGYLGLRTQGQDRTQDPELGQRRRGVCV